MAEAFLWGLLAGSSLVIGGLVALTGWVGNRFLGLIMAFGAGVLISAVAYELVAEAFTTRDRTAVTLGLFAGAASSSSATPPSTASAAESEEHGRHACRLALRDRARDRAGRHSRGNGIGLGLLEGGAVSAAVIAAVFLSNLPEAIAATSGLLTAGWRRGRILALWTLVALVTALASLAGYALFDGASDDAVAFVLASPAARC